MSETPESTPAGTSQESGTSPETTTSTQPALQAQSDLAAASSALSEQEQANLQAKADAQAEANAQAEEQGYVGKDAEQLVADDANGDGINTAQATPLARPVFDGELAGKTPGGHVQDPTTHDVVGSTGTGEGKG